jgi:hypothetical protein
MSLIWIILFRVLVKGLDIYTPYPNQLELIQGNSHYLDVCHM